MSAMGVKIDLFDVPICSSFQAKIMNDQLCYAVDLNKFSQKSNTKNELKLGFSFLMDYNEDRQVTFDHNISKKELGLVNVASSDDDQHAFVYLDTIGKNNDCEAQGKGRAKGQPRKVNQRSFIDGGWWISFP